MLRWFASWWRGRGSTFPERPARHPSSPPRWLTRRKAASQLPRAPRNDGDYLGRIPDGDIVLTPGYPRWSELVTKELPLAGPAPSYVRPYLERDKKPLGEAGGWQAS
jgi:hypothetical protein